MTTSGPPVTACTTLPACTSTAPVRPATGARTVQYESCSLAFWTAAASACTVAPSASAEALAASCCSFDTIPWRKRDSARSASAAAFLACAWSRARADWACRRAASNGRGSIVKSRSPALTSAPSRKWTEAIAPLT